MRVCNDGPTLQCYTPRSSDECGLSPCTHEGDPVCLEPGTCHTFSEPWGPCGYYPGETSVAVTEGIVGSKVRLVACRIHC
jgi:hypothetical protein